MAIRKSLNKATETPAKGDKKAPVPDTKPIKAKLEKFVAGKDVPEAVLKEAKALLSGL